MMLKLSQFIYFLKVLIGKISQKKRQVLWIIIYSFLVVYCSLCRFISFQFNGGICEYNKWYKIWYQKLWFSYEI